MKVIKTLVAAGLLFGLTQMASAAQLNTTKAAPKSDFATEMAAEKVTQRQCRGYNAICSVDANCCSGRCAKVTKRCRPVSGF